MEGLGSGETGNRANRAGGRQMNVPITHMSEQGGGVVPRAQLPGVLFTTGLKRAVMCSDGL